MEQYSMTLSTFFKPVTTRTDSLESRFRQGDMGALEEIIRTHQQGIYQLGLRLFCNRDTAADFAQDVFIKAFEQCRKYNSEKPFTPWLYTVATNLGRDRLRRKKECPLMNEEALSDRTADKADTRVIKGELQRKVWSILAGMSPTYREVLALRFSRDLSTKEIAEALGIGLSAVKVRLHRGMKAFEEAFKAQGGERYVV